MQWNQYVLGDCFDHFPEVESNSVDLVFTSVPDLSETDLDDFSSYESLLERSVEQCCRVVKDDGFMVFTQTDRKKDGQVYPKHVTITNQVRSNGFKLKDYKILMKGDADKISLYVLNYSHILIFTRSGVIPTSKRKGYYLRDLWKFPPIDTNYFNPKFTDLVVETLTKKGDRVVDPFAGRGTVLESARKKNRKYFGVEISEDVYNSNFGSGENDLNQFFTVES